jgi:hypothetical protein
MQANAQCWLLAAQAVLQQQLDDAHAAAEHQRQQQARAQQLLDAAQAAAAESAAAAAAASGPRDRQLDALLGSLGAEAHARGAALHQLTQLQLEEGVARLEAQLAAVHEAARRQLSESRREVGGLRQLLRERDAEVGHLAAEVAAARAALNVPEGGWGLWQGSVLAGAPVALPACGMLAGLLQEACQWAGVRSALPSPRDERKRGRRSQGSCLVLRSPVCA